MSYFGRYSSCAYFQIKGGAALTNKPFYPPFRGNPAMGNKCDTARGITTPRGCNDGKEPCLGLTEAYERPAEYQHNKSPPAVTPATISGSIDEEEDLDLAASPEEQVEAPSTLSTPPQPVSMGKKALERAPVRLIGGLSIVDTRTLTATSAPTTWQESSVVVVDASSYPNGWTLRVDAAKSVEDRVAYADFAFWGFGSRKDAFQHELHAPFLAKGNSGIDYHNWEVPVGESREFQVTLEDIDGARDSRTLNLVVI